MYDPTPAGDGELPHPDHIDFMIEVEDYVPEDNQDFVLGIGLNTPRMTVDPGKGKILKGSKARRYTRKREREAQSSCR